MLRLSEATVTALVRHASATPDREVCGLVWLSEGLQHVRPLANVHSDPTRYYRTSTDELRSAFAEMGEGAPLAWYHSHPGGKPDPSETDMQGAFDTQMHYLILYPEDEELMAGLGQVVGQARYWKLSAWECPEPGLLLAAEWRMS